MKNPDAAACTGTADEFQNDTEPRVLQTCSAAHLAFLDQRLRELEAQNAQLMRENQALIQANLAQQENSHPPIRKSPETEIPKHLERRWRQRERDLQSLLDNVPAMISYWDRNLHNRFGNRAYQEWFGIDPRKMPGMHIREVIGEAGFHLDQPHIEAALAGEHQLFEREILCPDSTRIRYSLTHYIPDIADGDVQGFYVMVLDITAEKEIEAALRASEERYRAVVQDQTEIICRSRRDGTVTFVNDIFCRTFKKSPQELLGTKWHPVVLPDDMPAIERQLNALTPENPVVTIENQVYTGDGNLCWVQFVNRGFFDADGTLLEIQSVGRDISEQKRVNEALRMAHARFQYLTDANLVGIVLANAEGDILEANDYYLNILGRTREELKAGQVRWIDMTPPEWLPADHKNLAELQATGTSSPYEKEYLRRDGTRRSVFLANAMLPGADGQILALVLDMTERKREAERLQQAELDAQKANNAKSRFLAAASHDLRQPLSALSIYSNLLRSKLSPADAPLVANIKNCIDSLNELLTDLLDLSKLQAGVFQPNICTFDVTNLLNKVVSAHAPEARRKNLFLRYRSSSLTARTDPVLLGRLLGNFVANAIRYTEQGGMLIACRRHQGKAWIEVWDTGVGIPADKTAEIFEEFRQLNNNERCQEKGSGLGLAIVAKTAELLGLQIRVKSRVGKGSMFAVELPLGSSSSTCEAAPATNSPALQPIRIGLVDDNPAVLQALAWSLENAGHQVIAANSGQELLTRLGKLSPNIVITDFRLGNGETGFDVIAALRSTYSQELAAIITTGDTDPELMRDMIHVGILVQHKPLNLDSLLAAIGKLTARPPA